MKRNTKLLVGGAALLVVLAIVASTLINRSALTIANPYANIDWEAYVQFKANLHTHTTLSDGKVDPAGVIDMYHDHGYKILSLTDHDTKGPEQTTWPWQDFGRDPEELAMIAIEGNEISRLHHINSFYSEYADANVTSEEEIFLQISHRDGLAVFNHPGRYTNSEKPEMLRSLDWYCDHFLRHLHVLGLEIYNQMDRYPGDRELWDAVLAKLLPDRPVWGFANDDMHLPAKSFAYSWNIILVPQLEDTIVRDALESGQFFFAHSPQGKDGSPAPVINRIFVDEKSSKITVEATGYESIEWIAEGKRVHVGKTIDLSQIESTKYVRAIVHGAGGSVVGTQPFVIFPDDR